MSDGGPEEQPATLARDEADSSPARVLVNVADLRRRLGQRQIEPVDISFTRQTVVGSHTTPEPVVGEVIVESIERGVSVMGAVTFHWEGDCRRCLEITGGAIEVDIAEIFQVDAPEDSELIDFDGDQVDLVPVVRDAVVLSLPLAPLCGDDCAGPDPDRYPAMTIDESERLKAEEAAEAPDPRWAALDQLKLDDN